MKLYENLDLQDLEGETWKNIEDYPDYMVSNLGRVKSFKQNKINGKILKQKKNKRYIYLYIDLCENRKISTKKVHRLVLETFKPIKNFNNLQCNHIDGDKKNNLLENLEWCNNSENQKHAFKIGLENNQGDNNPNSKLIEENIIQIKLLLNKKFSLRKIAKIFKISHKTIWSIKHGKLWSNVK